MATPRRRVHTRGDDTASDVRAVLVERRVALGLTQEQLADLAGVSRPTVQRFESGSAATSLSTVGAIADALGVRVALLDGRGRELGAHR